LFQLFLGARAPIGGKKGTHVKTHLGWGVLEGYPHRAGASSQAATVEAITATAPANVADADRNIVTLL
jgi:hypothetical protein